MIGIAGTAALLLSIGLLCARRIDTAAQLCALQALVAAAPLGGTALPIALCAVVLNGVALPLAITRMNSAAIMTVRGGAIASWAATFGLVTVISALFARFGAGGSVANGVSVALLGLLASQNGLVLVAGAHPALSLPAALATAVPLVPGLILANRWLRR
jgi:hypothetical protein